ncbi:hypothetical protein [Actinomadura sp. CNU-125]|uniref:hypothetical protein n=1 Tax=Actinomadura sp. CNU-125 TaxID=1904961 RepID=UPI001300FBD0|nr:hypothetical protein [Actinomadura sp. CNU-125]
MVYYDTTKKEDLTYDEVVGSLTKNGDYLFEDDGGAKTTCFDLLDGMMRSSPDTKFPNGEDLYLKACFEALRAWARTQPTY